MAKSRKKSSPIVRGIKRSLGTFFRIIASFFMVCIITGCIVLCALTVYILDYVGTLEDIDIRNIDLNYTSIIYANDKDGNPFELSRVHGEENRIWVDIDKMPKVLIDVAIAAEDKRFMHHHGVDWQRTIASALNMFLPIYSIDSGGSTITQQLIKNATDQWAPNVERKVKEIFSALKLENKYDKTEIIEAYLNVAAFGNNTNGVQAAANLYFNKDVSELNLAECAAIVAMTKAPTKYDLFRYPEVNAERRNEYIIPTMVELGSITQAEADKAIATQVVPDRSQAPAQRTNASNTWFVDHVIEDVIAGLMQKNTGMSYADAQIMVFRGGLRIYTTVDSEMQADLETRFIDIPAIFPPIRNAIYPEASFVVLDLHGRMKAVVGSNRKKQGDRWLNYATQVPRQPGSTMKPISAYLQGIESDYITWSTLYEDSPLDEMDYATGVVKKWPVNYYEYYDPVPRTCVFAMQKSINTIPCKILKFLQSETSLYFLHDKAGMKNLVTPEENGQINDANLSAMALGGTTLGVTPLELAAAYQINGNGGTFTPPTSYYRVLDSEGNTVLEADTTAKRVITKETSSILNLMMQQVTTTAPGTGTGARLSGAAAGTPVAGKTGTSSDNKDQWFVGMTPYYIGVVWMGYAPTPQPINYIQFPTPIAWRNLMQPLHEGLPVINFEYSQNIVQRQYCLQSGDLAAGTCSSTASGWYKTSNIPPICTSHYDIKVSQQEGGSDSGSKASGAGNKVSSGSGEPGEDPDNRPDGEEPSGTDSSEKSSGSSKSSASSSSGSSRPPKSSGSSSGGKKASRSSSSRPANFWD